MARPSRPNGVFEGDIPEGMKKFIVVGPTIRDSLGAYCAEGQEAILNEPDAKRYHRRHLIAVDLPEFITKPSQTEQQALEALEAMRAQLEKERADFERERANWMQPADGEAKEAEKNEGGDDGADKSGAGESGQAAPTAGANRRSTRT